MEPYLLVKNFINDDIINEYIKRASNHSNNPSKVGSTVQVDKKRRKDVFFNNTECQLLDEIIFNEKNYIIKTHFDINLKYRETYKLGSYYSENKGFYNPHTDTQGGPRHRKISMVICLSNVSDYEGGVFSFIDLDKKFRFDKGDAIFFDSNLLHGVEPVTKGLRQVLISFLWDEHGEEIRNPNKNNSVTRYQPNINIDNTQNLIFHINEINIKNTIYNYEDFNDYDKKIISYSLWGDSEIFNYTIVENALVAKKLCPDFMIYVFFNDTVLKKTFDLLKTLDNVRLIKVKGTDKKASNMLWRFKPMFFSDSIVLSRDADSLINERDAYVINDFEKINCKISSCKDNPHHMKYHMLGGMWGSKNGILNTTIYQNYFDNFSINHDTRGIDQNFLEKIFIENIYNIQLYVTKNNKSHIYEKHIKELSIPGKHIGSYNYYSPLTRSLLNESNEKLTIKRYYSFSSQSYSVLNNLLSVIPPDSGPGNQIISVKEGLILSKLLNRVFIMPPIREHYVKSNTVFYNFNDIFKYDSLNIIIDNNKYDILNSINYDKIYTMHGNYYKKKLRHEHILTKDVSEVLLNTRSIKTKSSTSELENIKDNILIIKHPFNNVYISESGINGSFYSNLNKEFSDIYKDICSKWSYSDNIVQIGTEYIENILQSNYVAIHIRMPDIMNGKNINEIINEVNDSNIVKIINKVKQDNSDKKIFIASNNINYIKNIDSNFLYYEDQNREFISFIDQYICSQSSIFYYLNLENTRWGDKNNRSTYTSFILDYRNYNLMNTNNINLHENI